MYLTSRLFYLQLYILTDVIIQNEVMSMDEMEDQSKSATVNEKGKLVLMRINKNKNPISCCVLKLRIRIKKLIHLILVCPSVYHL